MNAAKFYNILYSLNPNFPGQIILLPKGLVIFNKLKALVRNIYVNNHFQEISSPSFGACKIWQQTKHEQKYLDNMYKLSDDYYLKPMNCPMHIEIMKTMYNSKSVLPISVFEFNYCFRKEKSGAVNSLFRLLRFTQDDCHTILSIQDTAKHIRNFILQVQQLYKDLQIPNIFFRLSNTHIDFIGNEQEKIKAFNLLQNVLDGQKIQYTISQDGAFYGPKLDIMIVDNKGKQWQTGTIQIDLCTLHNLNFKFKNHDLGIEYLVIHQALLGTFERFIGILLDNNIIPSIINPFRRAIVIIEEEELYQQLQQKALAIQDIDIYLIKKYEINNIIKKIYRLQYEEYCIIGPEEIKKCYTKLQKTKTHIQDTQNNNKINLNKLLA